MFISKQSPFEWPYFQDAHHGNQVARTVSESIPFLRVECTDSGVQSYALMNGTMVQANKNGTNLLVRSANVRDDLGGKQGHCHQTDSMDDHAKPYVRLEVTGQTVQNETDDQCAIVGNVHQQEDQH